MSAPEIVQLELLAEVDELIARLTRWAESDLPWEPMRHSSALLKRLLSRIEHLRVRLESPLLVATFGGTGTGKSTLVNALVGQEVTEAGRERPTTKMPVLIAHPNTDLDSVGLALEEFEIVRVDAPLLRDIVIVDCPDPDTTEAEVEGSNLQRLHKLLPHCDVLIYTTTQQKYRSARVLQELEQAATGCRLLFVQTRADLDEDIRDDWSQWLRPHYEVPEMFFVDSAGALRQQQAGQAPGPEFARLQDVLATQLAASQRIQIRRANLLDLVHAVLERCRRNWDAELPAVQALEDILEQERSKLVGRMSQELCDELLVSRNLWERRLLSAVTDRWGVSPFSSMLRLYAGLGNLIASFTLFRARNSAQVALIGAMQGARWLKSRQSERTAESQLERVALLGLDDDFLRESQLVVAGYVRTAKLDPALLKSQRTDALRNEAARMEGNFLDEARRRIDGVISELAVRSSGFFLRMFCEFAFLLYVGFVLYRVGRNFFYDSFVNGQPLLAVDFYIPAGIFFVLWTGLLVIWFTWRMRRGLAGRIRELSEELAHSRLSAGLFPRLEEACRQVAEERENLISLGETTARLRRSVAGNDRLGAALHPVGEPIRVGQ